MTGVRKANVAETDSGMRLDRWFRREFPALPHGRLEKLLRRGEIRLDGRRAKGSSRLASGQEIRLPPSLEASPSILPPEADPAIPREWLEALRRSVLYKDESVVAIDKPAGLAVQGGSGLQFHLDAMLEALRFGAAEKPRLVHRLDKDTSGVLLLARTRQAAHQLSRAFSGRVSVKIYWAVVAGVPVRRRGVIDAPLAKRTQGARDKVAGVTDGGKNAATLFQIVETRGRAASWLALMPLTGRTHQLRAHCALLGTPILGDGKYGGKAAFLDHADLPRKLMLQAHELALPHPADGTTLRVVAPLPAHMVAAWEALGFDLRRGEKIADELRDYAANFRLDE